MRMRNSEAAISTVKGAIFNVRCAVSVVDGFGRHGRWWRGTAGVESSGYALSGDLRQPTLAAMKLRQGWGTDSSAG